MSKYIPSMSEAFNAKLTTTKELCESFIVNTYYKELASSNHSILVGPRGSGKTTLMRMLEVKSLEVWEKDTAQFYRDNIDFSGVFIPTDRMWKNKYEKMKHELGDDEEAIEILMALFLYHVLEQLAHVISYRTSRVIVKSHRFRCVDISTATESELVDNLSRLWCVSPKIRSIRSLIAELSFKKRELSIYVSKKSKGKELELPNVPESEFVETLNDSVSIINTFLNENGSKWALLFDELELAPDEIVQPLVDAMRGGHGDIILKLALSPYHKGVSITKTPESAMKNQDIKLINLCGTSELENMKFARQLFENIFKKNDISKAVDDCFENPKDVDVDEVFLSLSKKDASFEQYVHNRGWFGKCYHDMTRTEQNQVRKIKFIAYLRNIARKDNGQFRPLRKALHFYAGFENICKAVEYNPRMLIGISNLFIPIIKENKRVSLSKQVECIENYYESFKALLGTIALESNNEKLTNIYDLVEVIAKYFRSEIHGEHFKAEPKGSLVFKAINDKDLLEAVGYALNAGALIVAKNESSTLHDIVDVKHARCRLSYMFSHEFFLLLTLQKELDLRELKEATNLSGAKINVIEPNRSSNLNQLPLDMP